MCFTQILYIPPIRKHLRLKNEKLKTYLFAEGDSKMPEDHWLTEKQSEVLKLREEGLSQSEIAERMGTTRSNISAIERNARRNIRKSRRTLELAEVLKAPVIFEIEEGVDLYDVPRIIFEKGDEEGINVNLSGPELLRKAREDADPALQQKEVLGKIKVGITRDGEVNIEAEKPSQ